MMNLNHLRYFQRIARTGNITAVSAELHIAQPALSKVLNSLELEIGHKLFDRIGKSLVLNQQGKILLRYAEKIFSSLKDAQKELNDSVLPEKNIVSIRITAGAIYFVSLLAKFQRAHPNFSLRILDTNPVSNIPERPDITIFAAESPDEKQYATLLKERLALAVPADHCLAQNKSVCAYDIAGVPILTTFENLCHTL